jgi:hypothetical protein
MIGCRRVRRGVDLSGRPALAFLPLAGCALALAASAMVLRGKQNPPLTGPPCTDASGQQSPNLAAVVFRVPGAACSARQALAVPAGTPRCALRLLVPVSFPAEEGRPSARAHQSRKRVSGRPKPGGAIC